MTLGGVTGLQDCLLLPPVRATVEDASSREYLLLTCLRMQAQVGTRPVGVCVDNLQQCFQGVARALQAALPTKVTLFYGNDWDHSDDTVPENGEIYIHMSKYKALGIFLCEDPLHVYKRLLESVNFASRESAFLARSLQVLLGSWNPARRLSPKEAQEVKRDNSNISWIYFEDWELSRQPVVTDVLRSYFKGFPFPRNAEEILWKSLSQTWVHPETKKKLPLCSKIIVYRDVLKSISGSALTKDAVPALYTQDLTTKEIEEEMETLGDFFQDPVFAETRGGAQASWFQQQLKFLRHFRQRPVVPRGGSEGQTKVKPGSLKEPAGNDAFLKTLRLQSSPVVANGN